MYGFCFEFDSMQCKLKTLFNPKKENEDGKSGSFFGMGWMMSFRLAHRRFSPFRKHFAKWNGFSSSTCADDACVKLLPHSSSDKIYTAMCMQLQVIRRTYCKVTE